MAGSGGSPDIETDDPPGGRVIQYPRADRFRKDSHIRGSREEFSPFLPDVCRLAVALDPVESQTGLGVSHREARARECGRCRKFGLAGVRELQRIGNIGVDFREFDRPTRALRRRREILPVERNATPSPHRGCSPQHPPAIKLSRRMARMVDAFSLEEGEIVRWPEVLVTSLHQQNAA